MSIFPILSTGAVAQYPASYTMSYRADIVSFLDGTEQRLRNAPSVLYEWEIDLSQLNEPELAALELFFVSNQGAAVSFAFTDPWSNTSFANCSLVGDDLDMTCVALMSSKTKLVIRQNRV